MQTTIELDRVRNFRYGMKSLAVIEDQLGTSISALDMDNLTIRQTAIVLWAGLVHEDKELTPDKVMDLVDDHSNMPDALEAMSRAFQNSFSPNGKAVAPSARPRRGRSR